MDIKDLFNLDKIFGKKLVTVAYYVLTAVIVLAAMLSILSGIAQVFSSPFMAMLRILLTIPTSVVAFIILRVICEALVVFFEKNKD